MNSRVLRMNLAALDTRQPELAHRIRHASPDGRLRTATARDGSTILQARLDRGERTLNSLYDPGREAARRIAGTEDAATLVVFGAGAMIDARIALEGRPEQAVVVADLGPSVWRSILEAVTIDDLLASGRLRLADTGPSLTEGIHAIHHAVIRDGVTIRKLRSWTELPDNRDRFTDFERALTDTLEAQAGDLAAYRRFGTRWFLHILRNSLLAPPADRYPELVDRLRDREVVVLGAGPSIESFLDNPGSAPIVCVDTAYPALRRLGVVPDAVVTVDAHAWSALHLRRPVDQSTILISDIGVSSRYARTPDGTVQVSGGHPLADLLDRAGSPLRRLPTPYTSVTEAAILIARAAGAGSIRLLGFDVGYPRAKTYARGTYHYDLFTRRAVRGNPQEARFAQFVYQRDLPRTGSPPFFPLPGADAIRRRAHYLIVTEFDFNKTLRVGRSEFDRCAFWADHRENLEKATRGLAAVENRSSPPERSTPEILTVAGAHGCAHIPFHAARLQRVSTRNPDTTSFSESLRFAGAIVADEMSRYC